MVSQRFIERRHGEKKTLNLEETQHDFFNFIYLLLFNVLEAFDGVCKNEVLGAFLY